VVLRLLVGFFWFFCFAVVSSLSVVVDDMERTMEEENARTLAGFLVIVVVDW